MVLISHTTPATGDEMRNPPPLNAILAYQVEGHPLDTQQDGDLRLVIISEDPNQVTDGHWSVKWVNKIEVRSTVAGWGSLNMTAPLMASLRAPRLQSCSGCHPAPGRTTRDRFGVVLNWRLMGYADDAVKHEASRMRSRKQSGFDGKLIAADGYEGLLIPMTQIAIMKG